MEAEMLNGTYRCVKEHEYDIKVKVHETAKSYIMQLVEDNSRFFPAHIDMLFGQKNKAVIKKENSKHYFEACCDGKFFIIYPFRMGIPFLFDIITE